MRDHAHTLSDFRVPSLSIECEPCGRRGRYNVAKLMEKYGDAKLPELRHVLANCPKAKAASVGSKEPHAGEVCSGQGVPFMWARGARTVHRCAFWIVWRAESQSESFMYP